MGTALVAELWGVLLGLRLAWSMSVHHLLLETDSKSVAELLQAEVVCHRHWELIIPIKELLTPNWNVEVKHIYREANKYVDFLADTALGCPREDLALCIPP